MNAFATGKNEAWTRKHLACGLLSHGRSVLRSKNVAQALLNKASL